MKWLRRLLHKCKDFKYKDNTIYCPKCDFIIIASHNKYKTGYIWTIPDRFSEDQKFEIISLLYENSPNGHIEIRVKENYD